MQIEKGVAIEMRIPGSIGPVFIWKMKEGEKQFIGRSPTCDVHVPHFTVSRKHAMIKLVTDQYLMYEDLNSINGSWVNGYKLGKPYLFDLDKAEQVILGESDKVLCFKRISDIHKSPLINEVGVEEKSPVLISPGESGNRVLSNICLNLSGNHESEKKVDLYTANTPKAHRAHVIKKVKKERERTSEKSRRRKVSKLQVGEGVLVMSNRSRSRSFEKENRR